MLFRSAQERLERLRARLVRPLPESMVLSQFRDIDSLSRLEQTFSESGFMDAVRRSKEYISRAIACRCRSSQRTSRPFEATPLSLYRALRGLNPSPYMFYFDFQ